MARSGYKIYEKDIVRKIIKYLNSLDNCSVKKRAAGMYNASEPDVTGVFLIGGMGVRLEIEVKVPGKKPTDKQWQKINSFGSLCCLTGYVDCVEDVEWLIQNYRKNYYEKNIRKKIS